MMNEFFGRTFIWSRDQWTTRRANMGLNFSLVTFTNSNSCAKLGQEVLIMSYDNWSRPHTNWQFVTVLDLGYAAHTCDYCTKENIRYVHHLRHEAGYETQVGCVCAGHLTGRLDLAEVEAHFLSQFKKRETFIDSPRWKISKKGNWWRKFEGRTYVVTMAPRPVALVYSGLDKYDLGVFKLESEAQGACFDFATMGPEMYFKGVQK